MSTNAQWSRHEAGLALSKIFASQNAESVFDYSQTSFIVANTVALMDCVIDGTKLSDSSFCPQHIDVITSV